MNLSVKKITRMIALMNEKTEAKIPVLKPVIECFDLAMNERILDFLLEVGTKVCSLEELQTTDRVLFGKDSHEEQWESMWKEILEMGFLIPAEEDHEKYELAPIFPGWIELSCSGPLNEKREAILKKWTQFWKLLQMINIAPVRWYTNKQIDQDKAQRHPRMTTYLSTGVKTVTLDEPVTSTQEIRTAGDVYALLQDHKDEIAVMNCICRTHKMMEGKECDFDLPIEGCMNVGPLTQQLVDCGISRKISYEEACDLLYEFEKKGAVHTLYHYHNDADREAYNICNCCKDCCLLYASPLEGYLSKVFVRAFYKPEMKDESRCVGCNLCGRYCPTKATCYDKKTKRLVYDYDSCVGCGQCVVQCAFDVREMVKDERSVYVKSRRKEHA